MSLGDQIVIDRLKLQRMGIQIAVALISIHNLPEHPFFLEFKNLASHCRKNKKDFLEHSKEIHMKEMAM